VDAMTSWGFGTALGRHRTSKKLLSLDIVLSQSGSDGIWLLVLFRLRRRGGSRVQCPSIGGAPWHAGDLRGALSAAVVQPPRVAAVSPGGVIGTGASAGPGA